jgi:CHAT domain-containing protein
MNRQLSVVNVSGSWEETILQLAKHLGRGEVRRAVFNLIYGRASKPRSKKQIAEALGRAGNTQVIQDSLEYLAKHHLIVRMENSGQIKDASRWVYGKDEVVRANRDKILKYADDPAAAKKVPTTRRPASEITLSFVKPATRVGRSPAAGARGSKKQAQLRIALLVTNPDSQASLQTGVEARYIDESIRLASRASEVDLKVVLAPTLDTLLDMLNSYRPDVIHFSGHGGGRALVFDNEKAGHDGGTVLDFDMIARVVGATSTAPKLLVLVACDTVDGADRFLDAVPVVIAMAAAVDDVAACEFSARFYRSLSGGATISNSLVQAKLILENKGYADAKLPTLLTRDESFAQRTLL